MSWKSTYQKWKNSETLEEKIREDLNTMADCIRANQNK